MSQFTNKIAFITGGTSGIGRATALAFAREGAHVVLTGRREKEGQAVAQEITQSGGQALFIRTDISQEKEVEHAVAQTLAQFGRLDLVLNNAGVEESFGSLTAKTDADYDLVFNTNVRGVFYSLKYQIPALLQSGGGSIVNVSSVAGLIGMAAMPLYVASKHAVIGLTKAVALDVAKQNIRVNAIAPAAIQTDMIDRFANTPEVRDYLTGLHPVGRIGTAQEIAELVLFLSSPQASFITGATVPIDGGFTAQ